jgi:hypothetical protein
MLDLGEVKYQWWTEPRVVHKYKVLWIFGGYSCHESGIDVLATVNYFHGEKPWSKLHALTLWDSSVYMFVNKEGFKWK